QDDERERDDHRPAAEAAGADVVGNPRRQGAELGGVGLRGARLDGGRRFFAAHAVTGGAVPGMPEPLVGAPAVIACTTSSWVVFARSKTPTLRPRRNTVIRVAISKTSCRLWEMRT